MPEEKSKVHQPASETGNDYQAPQVEEVVTRDNIAREVAYAGLQGPSQITN